MSEELTGTNELKEPEFWVSSKPQMVNQSAKAATAICLMPVATALTGYSSVSDYGESSQPKAIYTTMSSSPLTHIRKQAALLDEEEDNVPSYSLLNAAESLYSLLHSFKIPKPTRINLGPTGYISFNWMTQMPGRQLFVHLSEDDDIECDWLLSTRQETIDKGRCIGTPAIALCISKLFSEAKS